MKAGLIYVYIFVVVLVFSAPLWASCTTTQIGNQALTNCSDGTSYSAGRIGETTVYSGDISGTTNRIGNTQFHDLQSQGRSLNGTSTAIGNTSFHNLQDNYGNSYYGDSTRIGNTTFHNLYGDGVSSSGTTSRIGNSEFSTWDDDY